MSRGGFEATIEPAANGAAPHNADQREPRTDLQIGREGHMDAYKREDCDLRSESYQIANRGVDARLNQ